MNFEENIVDSHKDQQIAFIIPETGYYSGSGFFERYFIKGDIVYISDDLTKVSKGTFKEVE